MNFRELPEITERQKEIMDLVYRFRFINRAQLQRYFNHKDARRINTWLRDLVAKGYLGRIYSKKLLENTKPAIYYLSNNGIIHIRYRMGADYGAKDEKLEVRQIKKFYEDKNASQSFINHSVALFELFLQIEEHKRSLNKIRNVLTQPSETDSRTREVPRFIVGPLRELTQEPNVEIAEALLASEAPLTREQILAADRSIKLGHIKDLESVGLIKHHGHDYSLTPLGRTILAELVEFGETRFIDPNTQEVLQKLADRGYSSETLNKVRIALQEESVK